MDQKLHQAFSQICVSSLQSVFPMSFRFLICSASFSHNLSFLLYFLYSVSLSALLKTCSLLIYREGWNLLRIILNWWHTRYQHIFTHPSFKMKYLLINLSCGFSVPKPSSICKYTAAKLISLSYNFSLSYGSFEQIKSYLFPEIISFSQQHVTTSEFSFSTHIFDKDLTLTVSVLPLHKF